MPLTPAPTHLACWYFIEMAACVEFRGENNEVGFASSLLQ